jgi:hypothetical protein
MLNTGAGGGEHSAACLPLRAQAHRHVKGGLALSLKVRIVVMLFAFIGTASATITFERTWGFNNTNNYAYCVEQTPDDGYILTFAGQDSAHQEVGYLLGTDSLGNLEWWRQYYSPTNSGAVPNGLCATLDRGYVLAGNMGGIGVSDGWAVKADSVGDTLWTYVHAGPGYDRFISVAPTPDSGCVLAGCLTEGSDNGMALLKLSREGRREWLKFYCPPGKQTGGGWVWQTRDRGFFYVGCMHDDTSGIEDWYLVKTDSVGDTIWTTIYRPDVPDYRGTWMGSACPTADGGCALCGTDAFDQGHVSYLAKLDSLGHGLFARSFFRDTIPGPHVRMVQCVQEAPDRGFILVGHQDPTPSRVLMARFDSLGDTLWTRGYDGSDPTLSDDGYWVVNTRDHGFAVSGIADERPAYLIKTDSMGLVSVPVSEGAAARSMLSGLTAQPNPFRSSTVLRLTTGPLDHSTTLLRIYDQAGRVVREFPGLDVKRGMYSVTWDGRDAKGSTLASGIYFVRLKSGDYAATEKLVLQR